MARAVNALIRENRLGYFSPIADTPGFVRAATATIQELRLNAASPSGDMACLLETYTKLLDEADLADLADVFTIAAQAQNSPYFGLPLVLLDIPVRTQAEKKFLESLIQRAPSVTILTLAEDDEFPFQSPDFLIEDLDEPTDSALGCIRKYLFTTEQIPSGNLDSTFEYFSAPGESFECIEIARRIQRTALPFDRIAVLVRQPARYQLLIEETFRRADIPCYFSAGTIRPDPSARAFLALLRCALEQLSATRFSEYLSLGQMPLAENHSPAPMAWEQFILDASVIGGADRWERRLAGLLHEFHLNEEPEFRIHQLQQLQSFAIPLICKLDRLPRQGTWSIWLDALSDLAEHSLLHPDGVTEVLQELEPLREIGPVSLEDVESLLSERLATLRHEAPPRRGGQVFVGTLEEARGRHFDLVFVPGLAEGLFPQRAMEDPLLLDEDRRLVGLPTQDTRFARERLLLRIAAASAETLIVSYPRMDTLQSRARVPSFYAFEVVRAAIGQIPDLHEFEETARQGASVKLGWPAPQEPEQAIDDTEYDLSILAGPLKKGTGRYMLDANPVLGRSLRSRGRRWRTKWFEEDGLIGEASLFLPYQLSARPFSATSLQRYSTCPYQFALHSIFRLRPRQKSLAMEQLDPLTRGILFHETQRCFLEQLSPWKSRLAEELIPILDEVLDQTAQLYEEKLAPAIVRVWQKEIESIRTDLHGWIRHLAEDTEWIPIHLEEEFEEDVFQLKLRGKIDVVEEHVDTRTCRITDHKTGKPPQSPVNAIGGGQFLQPLLYVCAFEQKSGRKVESARLFYATERGNYQQINIRHTPQAQEYLQQALQGIAHSIETGFLVPAPSREACKNCDYRLVCGPYEETRISRKPQDLLQPLQQLRRIP